MANEYGKTVLHSSVKEAESLKFLLAMYPDNQQLKVVEAVNISGETLLHLAAAQDHTSLKVFLELYPETHRLNVVKMPDESDTTIFF